MAAAELVERFSKLPIQHKVLGFAFATIFIVVLWYFMFYSTLIDDYNAQVAKIRQLEDEKATLENKKRQYLAFRGEVSKLLETQKELLKVLPSKAEIHSLLQAIHAQAELSGLYILAFDQQGEVKEQYYARIPVAMEVVGSFHQLNKFFYAISKLKRIVNVHNLSLLPAKKADLESTSETLNAKFLVSTFRFIKKVAGPGMPPGPGSHG